MRISYIFCGISAFLAAACGGSSTGASSGGSAGSTGGVGNGTGNTTGTSTGGGSATGNGSSFCLLGALGCPCDNGLCASTLACNGDTCCDVATGSCAAPPSNMSGTSNLPTTGVSAGGSGAGGGGAGPGPGMMPGHGMKPGPGGAGASAGGATASGNACAPGVTGPVITDCGYPYQSSNPLTNVSFNEDEVLRAIVPSGGSPIASIRVFYNDEHALTLGVRSVVVGSTSTDYPVSPLLTDPSSVRYPQTGTNILTGDQTGFDPSARPMWPSLFVTDTTDDPNARWGDWQQGGTPFNPNVIFGSWKSAISTVSGGTVSITPDADPAKNDWNLPGGDTAPSGLMNEGYGAEVRWDLVLVPGHSYRIQAIVHDGDQNKVGGDSGEACVDFCADAACPEDRLPCDEDGTCHDERVCSNGCCL